MLLFKLIQFSSKRTTVFKLSLIDFTLNFDEGSLSLRLISLLKISNALINMHFYIITASIECLVLIMSDLLDAPFKTALSFFERVF
jgi:hypothetical protein